MTREDKQQIKNNDVLLPAIVLGPGETIVRAHVQHLEPLFDLISDIYFYVKGSTGRWVTCNIASLRLLSLSRREEIFGAREDSFFPTKVAETIRNDDLLVLEKGVRITDRIELIANERGQLIWAVTNKLPLKDSAGTVKGLIGITRILPESRALPGPYEQFRTTVSFIEENISNPIRIPDLAAIAGISSSHFRRRFKDQFGLPAQEFVLRTRLQAASRLISGTIKPIGIIALECGFSDQSYFTRQFTRFFGQSPKHYRLRWQNAKNSAK